MFARCFKSLRSTRPTGYLRRGFTLIEILVVVAIIALLVAILLPSLARARAQSRMVVCQSNLRQLSTAFQVYMVDNKGRFPGSRLDGYKGGGPGGNDGAADWLGGTNLKSGQAPIYGAGGNQGKQPEWGTIYPYMGKQNSAYMCPDDPTALDKNNANARYSFTGNILLAGAKPDLANGAHIPVAAGPPPAFSNYNRKDHRTNMKALEGVPLIIEEHSDLYLRSSADDSGWCNGDTITARHLQAHGKGWGNIGYTDGHAGRLETYITTLSWKDIAQAYLQANHFCIRSGRKWVSGLSWNPDGAAGPMYKFLDAAPDASTVGVLHN